MHIARITGIFISWAVWTAAAMNLSVVRSPAHGPWMKLAVIAGFILGNYVYTQLWIDEGRARERAGRDNHRSP